jgi:predicted dehydrogenase
MNSGRYVQNEQDESGMSEPVGVTVIGTGMWGKRMLAAVKRTPSLRLLACYSRDAAAREATATEFGCAAPDSFEQAINWDGVQGVLLITPNNVHAEQAQECARTRKHIFVEKPIADTLEDGLAMRSACQSAGVTLFVGHGFRRLGAARKVRQILDEGRLGQVVLAEANFSLPGTLTPDKWRYYRKTCPGGPLMQLGIHHADTLQYWMGPAKRVHGVFSRLATSAEIDDVGIAQLEFSNGALGTLTGSYVSPNTYYLRLYGTEGVLEYQTDMRIWPKADQMDIATILTLRTKSAVEQLKFVSHDMLVDELDEFARCVKGTAQPETGALEGLRALDVILSAIRSHETGIPVALGEYNA